MFVRDCSQIMSAIFGVGLDPPPPLSVIVSNWLTPLPPLSVMPVFGYHPPPFTRFLRSSSLEKKIQFENLQTFLQIFQDGLEIVRRSYKIYFVGGVCFLE